MGGSSGSESSIRLLGLGNEILADDVFGLRVAAAAALRFPEVEVICSSAAGFHLLDDILGAERLIVVDTIMTGHGPPGTVRTFRDNEVQIALGGSPHASGLFDVLAKGRRLGLPVPNEVTIIAVEAADCTTVGAPMHPDVARAIEPVIECIAQLVSEPRPGAPRLAAHA
jgi:hydrogenase maturation protease